MNAAQRGSFAPATGWPAGLVGLGLLAGLGIAFVPAIDPANPRWPTYCDFGDVPEKISLLEFWNRSRNAR
jgi:hypothetical protein